MSQLRQLASTLLGKAPEMLANKVVSDLERKLDPPLTLRTEDRKRARKLVPLFVESNASCNWVKLPGPPGRRAFLAAAVRFLSKQAEEWAVIGLGTCARRSFVKEVFVRRGTAGRVGLPASVQAEIRGHLESTDGGEIIHVHNHPPGIERTFKNLVLGKAPITSDSDRDVYEAHVAVASTAARTTLSPRGVRFFVVENGKLHQYRLPTKGPLRDEAEQLFRKMFG